MFLVDTALKLIRSKGEAITITRTGESYYDPLSGDVMNGAMSSHVGYAVSDPYKESEKNETVVKSGDIRLYVNKIDISPSAGDVVTFDGEEYRIIVCERVRLQGEDVIYILQGRK